MKLLITGGAGFIGSNFIRYILKRHPKYKILNVDKLTYAGNIDNLKDVEDYTNYRFIKADICDEKKIDGLIRGCDAVINFAAETHVDRSIHSSRDFMHTNLMGTRVLLEAVRRHGLKRFLQISTDEVYGSILKGSFSEESPLCPNSPYSSSKAAADLLARSYFITYNLPVLITRSSNNFGPYQYPEKFIPLFVTNAIEGQPLPLYGDGKNVRDWIFVLDNCAAIDLVLSKGKIGEVYNIGADNEKQNIDVARLILKFMHKPEGLIKLVKDRPGHDRRYSLDCSKIKRLGWRPTYRFTYALKQTTGWYIENPDWWHKIKRRNLRFSQYYKKQYGDRI